MKSEVQDVGLDPHAANAISGANWVISDHFCIDEDGGKPCNDPIHSGTIKTQD